MTHRGSRTHNGIAAPGRWRSSTGARSHTCGWTRDAQLETIGRHTGRPHRTPICNGLFGTTVWVIAQHGRRSDYVRNLAPDPRVRVRTGSRSGWRTGIAHILDGDDPDARRRELGRIDGWRRLCLSASHAMSTDPLTIRIDLDPSH